MGSREALYRTFHAYRLCKKLLKRAIVPHPASVKPKRGYANAIDPDLIRVLRVFPSGPKGYGSTERMLSAEEIRWQEFTNWVDRKVQRLSPYQRSIIRIQFLDTDSMLTDDEVYERLWAMKFYFDKRSFSREKNFAMDTLSRTLKLRNDADS